MVPPQAGIRTAILPLLYPLFPYPLSFFRCALSVSRIFLCTLYIVLCTVLLPVLLLTFILHITCTLYFIPFPFFPFIISRIRTIPRIPNQRLWTGCAKVCLGICPHSELYFFPIRLCLSRVIPHLMRDPGVS